MEGMHPVALPIESRLTKIASQILNGRLIAVLEGLGPQNIAAVSVLNYNVFESGKVDAHECYVLVALLSGGCSIALRRLWPPAAIDEVLDIFVRETVLRATTRRGVP
jgi:hypothetical protein